MIWFGLAGISSDAVLEPWSSRFGCGARRPRASRCFCYSWVLLRWGRSGSCLPTVTICANNQGSESVLCPTRQSHSTGHRTKGPQEAQIGDWQKCNQKPIITRSKQAEQAETAKTGKGGQHGVFWFQALCVCLTFGDGGRVCVCVTANVSLVCYWTSKRGLCLKSVFYWEPTKRGERGKQCNQRGQNCLDDKETITSLNWPEYFQEFGNNQIQQSFLGFKVSWLN